MSEQDDRGVAIARGPDRELGAVERGDRPQILGRRGAERLDLTRMPATNERAPDHPGSERAGHHPRRDRRGPRLHPRWSLGTRGPIRETISYATVPALAASSHAETSSSP